ncbi:Eco57I restriction-modification methylase domain-containing protein [Colwellia hornerae]|uniref:site-specific DNA-methyltransferase (adenine-specific) n=1 Tax=Colwellia hornerae TaxID=89402 RepID=A0A5C6QFF0_9GAMM|nr:N-6 DNA methylase [Colwellia hornerae]TWX52638.1 N-6 DNA methylase [Colwellia hornerae]TWX58401.1 N-6 DNA methylase [Colwellia hornerae]TWX67453.1 N-6 DNA methylase [Colwellia hornerae]
MRTALEKTLRKKLEDTVVKAREIVEVAVTEALTRLGISEGSAPSYLSETDRKLRNRLRAHSRQLGDILHKETTSLVKANDQETELLINEMAYEHWHRMLFARFLEQSDLLMYEPGTPVTLDECSELAEDEADCKDGWELAGRLAEKMLPQIFRTDSPVFEVKLSINHVNALEELIAALHPDTFQASDSLGWCYQFWQNKKKKQVNELGVKIGAKELSPVTQLFTEPYMVSFLLDNALGAWWAKRRLTSDDLQTATSEKELRELAAIPSVPLEYLRFVQDENTNAWSNAAGDFDKWPEHLSELKTLDPCCGSGHFLVANFLMLVPMRMHLEALTAKQAIDKVLSENIHGLELDQRCVELAAFALALEAWRYPGAGGYRQLPELQLACSGLSINEAQKEWKGLAKDDEELQGAVNWVHKTFKDAPILGSLIDPLKYVKELGNTPWTLLTKHLKTKGHINYETRTTAQSIVKSASILSQKFNWVITNVPYLASGKQSKTLIDFSTSYYPEGRSDLATVFLERCLQLCNGGGTSSIVLPQNWLFLSRYKKFREKLLNDKLWNFVVLLGGGAEAFENGPGNITNICMVMLSQKVDVEKSNSNLENIIHGIDSSTFRNPTIKSKALVYIDIKAVSQMKQLDNPDSRITFELNDLAELLSTKAICPRGIVSGDSEKWLNYIFEIPRILNSHRTFQGATSANQFYSGLNKVIDWSTFGNGMLRPGKGNLALNKAGVNISLMGSLTATLYQGDFYDQTTASIVPKSPKHTSALYTYCDSDEFSKNVRIIDQKLNVTPATLIKIPFDEEKWLKIANEKYPNGLPKPFSDDLTQWIFHGHPCASVIWNEETKTTGIGDLRQDDTVLQVAVARLLAYRWPAELDADMKLAPEMREVLAKCKDFDGLVDDDGIVCIPAIRGEKPANDRLESILHAAYGAEWSATVLNNLLKSVKATNLNTWLRDKFFEQHSKLFQHRPFIWQIWDGLADGFSALVNYHTLDYKGLERLIYTYLDDWISTQIQLEKDGVEGAELRLSAARNLKESLEAILVGESNGKEGLDIFVRWKSLAEQSIGWNPDLNDGVRLNIRPFMQTKDVGKKEAGVLRFKPNIHWKKDRGTDVATAPWFDLGLEYGGKQGDRINDHHLSLADKIEARNIIKETN